VLNPVAYRYAKAILSSARDRNEFDSVCSDVEKIQHLLDESPDVVEYLLRAERSGDVSGKITHGLNQKLELSTLTGRLLDIISERKRLGLLPDIVKAIQSEIKEKRGKTEATVTSIRDLDLDEKERIQTALNTLTQKDVEIIWEQDSHILGGLYIRIGDQIFDGTLRNRVKQLQEHLIQG